MCIGELSGSLYFELLHFLGEIGCIVYRVIICRGGEVGVAKNGLHSGGVGLAFHEARGSCAAERVRRNALLFGGVLGIDAAQFHQAAEGMLHGVDIFFTPGGSGEQVDAADAVQHPPGQNVPDRGEDGDDALAASFGLFAADKIALIQMHVVPAHGEQLINTHAGVHQHQRDLSGEPQTVGRGGIVGDSLDALDLGAGEGALFLGEAEGKRRPSA